MKKTLCAILAVCAIGITFTACNKKAEEGFKIVENQVCSYSFQCPESWEVKQIDGMLSAVNTEDVSKANVTAYSFPHGDKEKTPSAIEYWETYKTTLYNTFGNVDVNEVIEEELGGQNVAHAKYSVTIGNENFVCETVLVTYADSVYTITLTQGAKTEENSEKYNNHSDEFAKIVKTFRIK